MEAHEEHHFEIWTFVVLFRSSLISWVCSRAVASAALISYALLCFMPPTLRELHTFCFGFARR